jgi:tetratricopeptide (TPR) repeat protein
MTLRSLVAAAAIALAPVAVAPAALAAQTPAEHVAMGDRDRDANPAAALAHYQAALRSDPNNYDALARGAYAAVEAGKLASDKGRQGQLYGKGEQMARRAVQVRPADAEGHFALAAAIGRRAQSMGSRDRVRFAGDVRTHALEALKYNPRHAGAMHVMGMWNAEVMRLNGMSRFMAKNFLGGRVFESANWNDAQRYLEQAVQAEPNRLTHRVDLASVYLDRGNSARAREQLDFVAAAPSREAGDAQFKREAEAMRSRLQS